MAEPHLEVRGVSVALNGAPFVRDLSVRVAPGEWLGLLGPNGAGKTTLLRTLYHGARPAAGEIRLNGRPQAAWRRRDWSRQVGALIQGESLLAGLTPTDMVEIGLRPLDLAPRDARHRLEQALDLAGLGDRRDQSAESLSGGERQRCHFAQLLARDPAIYVMDEPANHLDLHYQLKLLDEVRRRGRTVIATFHDLALAARYCDRVAVMERGTIVADGTVAEVLTRDRLARSYRVAGELRDGAVFLDGPV